jgi:alpha-galactosidase
MNGIMIAAMMAQVAVGATPSPAEFADARAWVAAKFEGIAEASARSGNAIEVVTNYDPLQPNARAGKPMRITGKKYTRGLYCHAPSKLVVRLAKPAQRFEAIVGVDSNEQTSGGRGSVVFVVHVGSAEAWRSGVVREGMPGAPVSVDLNGATEFVLEITDGGDGISCDQSDWADARVISQDGETLWLGDLPIEGQSRAPYSAEPFFSFNYGDRPSSEFLADWQLERKTDKLDKNRTQHTLTYTQPGQGLVIRCAGVEYHDFPTIEWTLFFKNTGSSDSPILSDIQAIDTPFTREQGSEFALHHHTGDNCTADSFEPHADTLAPNTDRRIANAGGRPTTGAFPYFNIASPGGGLLFVVSWAGQWSAQFTRDSGNGLRLRAGQELTHFTLHPGEEIRTPMIVLQFYKGDRLRAQNVWRQWMIAHNMPRPGGSPPPLPLLLACSSHQFGEMIHANTDNQIFFIDKYLERGIKLDYWWMDAGWYVNKTGWPNTGTWEVDTERFPGGLRPITDHAHAKGLKSVVWFEPERVTAGTWLAETHPEWILGGAGGGLLNLGNPQARTWLVNHVDGLLTKEGIDLYRQDFNIDPLGFWRGNDAEDRQGITEIRHVEGYFAYWDELRRRHPDMLIDSCASGGRRNDLETLRRALPLLRSDYIMEPVGNQCHTHALSLWFPFYGTGTSRTDTYSIRSVLCPNFIACWDMRDENLDYERLARIVAQWQAFGPCYFGDYYPLTPYTLDNDQWIAWQFQRPDLGKGVIQAFRRADSVYTSIRVPLHGLDPAAVYRLTNVDAPDQAVEITGKKLAEEGLQIEIDEKPGTGSVVYERD